MYFIKNKMFTITIDTKFLLISIIISIIIFISVVILLIVISYFVSKFLKSYNVLFYDYNKKTKQLLKKYGEYLITNIYLVRQPLSNFNMGVFNAATFYKYRKIFNEMELYHTFFIVELKQPNNIRKLLLLEKNSCIDIKENFNICCDQYMKKIKIKKKHNLNSILKNTQERIGINSYFNWTFNSNNCHVFTKEFLISINKYNKNTQDFIFVNDKFIKMIKPNDFSLHIGISIFHLYNFLEKYVYDKIMYCV